MVKMIEEAMKILIHVPEATAIEVLKIARSLGCSKRTVYRAKARIEQIRRKASKEVSTQVRNCQNIKWLLWMLLHNTNMTTKARATWQERVYNIIDHMKEQCGELKISLDEVGRVVEEDD